MNRKLHFKQTEEQQVYFCSDLHWNHNPKWPVPLWKSRGYNSKDEQNVHQIMEINRIVRPNDILVHLGDTTLNCSEEQFESLLSQLQCQNIYTLWGNHNSPSWAIYQREVSKVYYTKGYTGVVLNPSNMQYEPGGHACDIPATDIEIYPFRYRNMIFMGNYAEMVVDGHMFVLSHYPIYVFNEMKHGTMHLCGHSHYNLPLSQATNPSSKILDVGWDGKLGVWSVQEILDVMDKKNVLVADHHGKD